LAQVTGQTALPNYQQRLAALETEQQDLVRQIAAAGAGLSEQDPWISISTLRGELPTGSAMISLARFAPYDFPRDKWAAHRYFAWVIPASDEGPVKVVDLGEAELIERAVAELQDAIQQAETLVEKDGDQQANDALQKTLKPLAELAWKPISEHVADKEHLILSPDGALWLVPWAALPLDDGKCVLEKYRLRYVVSGRELVQQRTARTGISAPVVLADPDFNLDQRQGLPKDDAGPTNSIARRSASRLNDVERLPGTAREAKAIQASLARIGENEPVVFLDRAATETQFKNLFRPRVLVLSTHGFFLEDQKSVSENNRSGAEDSSRAAKTAEGQPIENPLLRCGLLLAGCNRRNSVSNGIDDGVLTGLEIVGTDLRGTELVVLSACETGVGEIRSGEGVAGLRQAFQLAGAQSVVATLWKIPDQETAQLMNDFFVYLSQGKSRSEALRYAQLAQIKSRRERFGAAHPYYWAAFTLTGKD
jgi:CHAT domain-containing protein